MQPILHAPRSSIELFAAIARISVLSRKLTVLAGGAVVHEANKRSFEVDNGAASLEVNVIAIIVV